MALMSVDDYTASLRERGTRVYFRDERIEDVTAHPILRASFNSIALQYGLAQDPDYADLLTADSQLTGERVNIANHVFAGRDDLMQRLRMERVVAQLTARGALRSPGMDALNALYGVTWSCDRAHGTGYHQRFLEYLATVQREDRAVSGAMTDPKGDRKRRPHQQDDPDAYVRVVEERDGGIVLRGAKLHQTSAIHCHDHMVVPGRAMTEADRDYAVACAVPADAEGVFHVVSRQPSDTRRLEDDDIDLGIADYGGNETLLVLDDVFVPWERVFLYGETDFTMPLVERFAAMHRACYGGCKAGIADVLIGGAALLAEYNGLAGDRTIDDKLTEMLHLTETMYACGIAAAVQGDRVEPDGWLVDLTYANVGKHNVTRFPYEIARLATDIAGGIGISMPSGAALRAEGLGEYVDKYLAASPEVPAEHRMRMARLVESLTAGPGAYYFLVESLHGAGSPQSQRLALKGLLSEHLAYCKDRARALSGVAGTTPRPPR